MVTTPVARRFEFTIPVAEWGSEKDYSHGLYVNQGQQSPVAAVVVTCVIESVWVLDSNGVYHAELPAVVSVVNPGVSAGYVRLKAQDNSVLYSGLGVVPALYQVRAYVQLEHALIFGEMLQSPDPVLLGPPMWSYVSGGTSDHSALSSLDFANAGHTGFAPAFTGGNGIDYSNAVVAVKTPAYSQIGFDPHDAAVVDFSEVQVWCARMRNDTLITAPAPEIGASYIIPVANPGGDWAAFGQWDIVECIAANVDPSDWRKIGTLGATKIVVRVDSTGMAGSFANKADNFAFWDGASTWSFVAPQTFFGYVVVGRNGVDFAYNIGNKFVYVAELGVWVNLPLVKSGGGLVWDREGLTTALAGSQIANTPAGSIASTDVQAALNELDTEKAAAAHVHAGEDITSGTVDGDRLPAMSATKLGGVPKTGNPSGLFLRDDGTFAAAGGGSNPIKIPLVLNQTTPSTVPVLAGGLAFNKTTYSLTTIKFRAVGSVTDANYTGTLKLYEDAVLMATLTFSSTSMTIQESAALSLAASEKYLEVQMYVSNIAASAIVAAAWLEITP